jgi:hypothetical protein
MERQTHYVFAHKFWIKIATTTCWFRRPCLRADLNFYTICHTITILFKIIKIFEMCTINWTQFFDGYRLIKILFFVLFYDFWSESSKKMHLEKTFGSCENMSFLKVRPETIPRSWFMFSVFWMIRFHYLSIEWIATDIIKIH